MLWKFWMGYTIVVLMLCGALGAYLLATMSEKGRISYGRLLVGAGLVASYLLLGFFSFEELARGFAVVMVCSVIVVAALVLGD